MYSCDTHIRLAELSYLNCARAKRNTSKAGQVYVYIFIWYEYVIRIRYNISAQCLQNVGQQQEGEKGIKAGKAGNEKKTYLRLELSRRTDEQVAR